MARVVGLDEVGRGCWAGPLVAAAVLFDDTDEPLAGLRDSKKLSRLQREVLAGQIPRRANAYGVGWVLPGEVDELGLTAAVRLAMQRALAELHCPYDRIIIDGTYNFLPEYASVEVMARADDQVPAVSAASIIAKVARDRYMINLAKQWPHYGFDKHVGYGTALHKTAVQRFGVCPAVHRRSFAPIRAILASAAVPLHNLAV